MGDKEKFDMTGEFQNGNYKSDFARSVVNQQARSVNVLKAQNREENTDSSVPNRKIVNCGNLRFTIEPQEVVRLRRNARTSSIDDTRRLSCSSIGSRRPSMCSTRISDVPVENIVHQSKVETLQWQLRETEKSREMYRAVMKQVVTFLERAHYSLELFGSRLNKKSSVPRSKSEHQIILENESGTLTNASKNYSLEDNLSLRDFFWQKPKKPELSPEEIPPEKLSQEAFRLLRTAQSLLNTQEPDLINLDPPSDVEFLAQLAKEFPQTTEIKSQRATSFSLSPKLILPDSDIRISTAFNRKLSLQNSEVRRGSLSRSQRADLARCLDESNRSTTDSTRFNTERTRRQTESTRLLSESTRASGDSARCSVAESECEFSTELGGEKVKEKSNSPATGSISSVEDESGFSSMNSFQDVGLPLINSTLIADEVSPKNALLRSMLHNTGSDYSSLNVSSNRSSFHQEHSSLLDNTLMLSNSSRTHEKPDEKHHHHNVSDVKLWQKPASTNSALNAPYQHKRWYSTPVEEQSNQSVKVLWV